MGAKNLSRKLGIREAAGFGLQTVFLRQGPQPVSYGKTTKRQLQSPIHSQCNLGWVLFTMTHFQPVREFCGLLIPLTLGGPIRSGWNVCGLHLCEEFGECSLASGNCGWW